VKDMKAHAKSALSRVLAGALGRSNYARLARFLWMDSRLDVGNDMRTNGEALVHAAAIRRAAQSSGPVCVLDVGANAGDWSALFLDAWVAAGLGPSRLALHVFEPIEVMRQRLTAALAARPTPVVLRIVAAAVADRSGTAVFHAREGGSSSLSTSASEAGFGPERLGEVITVPLVTLDDYCAEHGIERVDLLKIDTEGHDLGVLRGAERMLRAGRIEMAQFEYNQLWIGTRSFLKDVFDLVEPLGYRVGKVTPLGLETYRGWHYELESYREGNYLIYRGEPAMDTVTWWMDPPR
jgi:FkbM family methyltransferase